MQPTRGCDMTRRAPRTNGMRLRRICSQGTTKTLEAAMRRYRGKTCNVYEIEKKGGELQPVHKKIISEMQRVWWGDAAAGMPAMCDTVARLQPPSTGNQLAARVFPGFKDKIQQFMEAMLGGPLQL